MGGWIFCCRRFVQNKNTVSWPQFMTVACRGIGWYSGGSSTMPQVILKNVFNLPWSIQVWSGSQPKSLTIADTEVGSLVRQWGTLLTNLAALHWTISSWSTYFCWYGSQIQQQYSSLGRTTALYDFSFNGCGHLSRDRQRNPSMRFAAPLILSVCSFHGSLLFIVTQGTRKCQWDRLVLHPWNADNGFCCLLHWWWK